MACREGENRRWDIFKLKLEALKIKTDKENKVLLSHPDRSATTELEEYIKY